MPASETFVSAYIACALWSSTDNTTESGGYPLDSGRFELSDEARAAMRADCDAFVDNPDIAEALEAWDDEQAGHDLWLTRNRHGAGFWDRYSDGHPLEAMGRKLTAAAHVEGGRDLYVGDDGLIYQA